MLYKDILKTSFSNVMRSKQRSLLTCLSIFVGVFSVMLISTLGDSGSYLVNSEIDKIGLSGITIYAKNDNVNFTDEYIKTIKENIPQVKNVQPFVIETGNYTLKKSMGNALIWGIDSNVDRVMALDLLHGELPNASDVSQNRTVAVVDSELAMNLYGRTNIIGKEIIITVAGVSDRFTITGVVSSQKDGINQLVGGTLPSFIYIPYKTLCTMRGNDSVKQLAVNCYNQEDNNTAGELALKTLARISGYRDSFSFENINTHVTRLKGISSLVSRLLSAIAAISLLVAGLGIMNSMLASTGERKKEIGTMIALGATKRDIAYCFMTESAIISGSGGFLGAFIGAITAYIITSAANMPTIISLQKLLITVFISILCGITFAFLPATKASKLNPVDVLHE